MSASQDMTLVTLADERYSLTLAVLGRSLSENIRSGRRATLYVVDGGITPETKQHLIASWDSERIRVEFVPPQFGREDELPVWGRLPPLTYARVFVPLLVPEQCAKAIALDSDVVIRTDIERLWNMELGDKCLLAVQDPAVPFVSSRGGLARYQDLGIPSGHPYFNAGVMMINVEKWRRMNVSGKVMEFIHRNADELNYCDQDGLNAILWDDWEALDPRWQVQPRLMARNSLPLPHFDDRKRTQLTADPWILHFSGRLKPWMYRGSTPSDRIFYQYLDRTWWSGWRPPSSVKAWMYRLYDSRLRDWCYPIEQWGHVLMRNLSRRSVRV
jgi:lipopolysaccharide biosynthesis glycosyltransferase